MTVFVFPVSFMVDRWSRKKSIALMAILWSLAAGACALTRNFKQLFALRSVIGVGEAAYTAGGHAMIAAYFPEEKRATMNGLFTAAIPFGTAIGVILGGVIAVNLGWRYAFGLTALPGLVIAILFFWVKDYKTVEVLKLTAGDASAVRTKKTFPDITKEFVRTPSLIMTYLGYVGNTFVTTAFITWLPTYFHRTEGLPMDKAGMRSSVVFLLAIVGAPLGGMIADRWRKSKLKARMLFPALTSLIASILVFLTFGVFEGKLQYIFLLAFGLFAPMFASAGSAVTQDVVHPGLRAISYSMCQFFMMALGYSLSPILVGWISDCYDLITAFRFMPIFTLLGALAFFIGSFFYEADLAKVDRVVLEEENGTMGTSIKS